MTEINKIHNFVVDAHNRLDRLDVVDDRLDKLLNRANDARDRLGLDDIMSGINDHLDVTYLPTANVNVYVAAY